MITSDAQHAPDALETIVAADERPFCVRVGWLTANPGWAQRMQYRDGSTGCWLPGGSADHDHDPGWCVEVRLTEGAS